MRLFYLTIAWALACSPRPNGASSGDGSTSPDVAEDAPFPLCSNQIHDGDESDVDCGGRCRQKCMESQRCNSDSDCLEMNCLEGVCEPACGNGSIEPGEECDDGNRNTLDGCLNDCRLWPPNLSYPSLAYDESQGELLLFGGNRGTEFTNDTWLWSGNQWQNPAFPDPPPPRQGGASGYEPSTMSVVLSGGRTTTSPDRVADSWQWKQNSWDTFADSTPHEFGDMIYIPGANVLFLVTGTSEGPASLAYHKGVTEWVEQFEWLHPTHNTGHKFIQLALDPGTAQPMIFGGEFGTPSVYSNEVFVNNGSTWSIAPATNPPSPRSRQAMGTDPASNRVVIFGGRDAMGSLTDTWIWDGSSFTETMTSDHPPGLEDGQMFWSTESSQLYHFGGRGSEGWTNELWRFVGNDWQKVGP